MERDLHFLETNIDFTIVALAVFLLVKQVNRLKQEAPVITPAAPSEEVLLLREIRDGLKK